MNQFLQEIHEQPQALLQTMNFYKNAEGTFTLSQFTDLWKSGRYTHILLTGMGSSFFIASATTILLNKLKIPALTLNAGELLHDQLSAITPDTLLICISQSGESYEVIELIKKLSSHITILAISNEENSSLVKLSKHSLLCKAGIEEKTSTKTFITCYQVAYLLTMKLCSKEINYEQWNKLSSIIKDTINGNTPWMTKATNLVENANFIQLISRGPIFAAASQGALMFMEATHTPASAVLGGEFRHGPLEMVKSGFVAILFAHSQTETYKQSLSLIKDIIKYDGNVIFITDTPNSITTHKNLCTITIPCYDPDIFAIPAIIPVQLLINSWAIKKGITPGEFTHGAKVTTIE